MNTPKMTSGMNWWAPPGAETLPQAQEKGKGMQSAPNSGLRAEHATSCRRPVSLGCSR